MKVKDMFSTFKNSLGENIGQIDIYGPIGRGSFWEDEYSFKQFISEFREMEKTCSEIIINISSEGGSVFEGQAIASEIKSSKVKTTCKIGALCASIATVISSACDRVIIPNNALFMTHAPLTGLQGNAHDLRETANLLDKIEETILNIYVDKCGGKRTRDQIKDLISGPNKDGQGTWMDAYEALEAGFVDEIGHELKMVAQYDGPSNVIINGVKMDISNFKNTTKLKELIENKNSNKLEETNMSEIQKSGLGAIIDEIANHAKSLFGVKNEVEPETQFEATELVAQEEETTQEVSEVEETVAEETEAQEEIVEPNAEVAEEIEPSEETEPVATVELDIVDEDATGAEEQLEQEEPEVEVAEEVTEEPAQEEQITEEQEQAEEEIEPSTEAEAVVPEVTASIDLADELAKVKDELNKIKEADAQKAIALAKAELAKEVGNKFKGVPGKLEDKVELIYELKNSALSDSSKEMIFKSLENLSTQNLEACQELGHSEEIIVDEQDKMSQAKALAQKEGISEGQAILVLDGTKTLKQVKNKK